MLQKVLQELKSITERMQAEDKELDAENDWKFAAMVIDRVCLISFSVFLIVTTGGIILSAPFLIT